MLQLWALFHRILLRYSIAMLHKNWFLVPEFITLEKLRARKKESPPSFSCFFGSPKPDYLRLISKNWFLHETLRQSQVYQGLWRGVKFCTPRLFNVKKPRLVRVQASMKCWCLSYGSRTKSSLMNDRYDVITLSNANLRKAIFWLYKQ